MPFFCYVAESTSFTLIIPALILSAIIISLLLFSILMIVVSALGGASTALFIKNKTARKLLFVGFCILSFIGLLFLIPFVSIYAQLPELFYTLATVVAFVCIGILSVAGFRYSTTIQNKIGKTVLSVVFGFILVIAVSFTIFIPVLRGFFMSS